MGGRGSSGAKGGGGGGSSFIKEHSDTHYQNMTNKELWSAYHENKIAHRFARVDFSTFKDKAVQVQEKFYSTSKDSPNYQKDKKLFETAKKKYDRKFESMQNAEENTNKSFVELKNRGFKIPRD